MAFIMATGAPAAAATRNRERRKSARRDAILAAARKVFAQHGYDGATIADIAHEAGVASGSVYLYYASKLDLFAALNEQLFEVVGRAIREADAPPDLRSGTRARIRAVFEACREYPDLLRLVFLNPDPRTAVARRMTRADEERLRPLIDLLAGGMEAGIVRRSDPVLLARLVNAIVISALYQCFVLANATDIETYEDVVTAMVVGGLAPGEETAGDLA